MTIQIPNHSHCAICTRAVPFGDKTCSAACQKQFDDLQKRRKRTVFFLYALMAASVVILLLGSFNGAF
ncbi:MAG TPA: DUF2116 family Zn-ribbon domain-containing protein [Candidatus Thermoplasmatota archaeon]|nr:DUF2116 family Zn-ribbon domain-containing protein [Candidatus Thermoplasmatota archaeon]